MKEKQIKKITAITLLINTLLSILKFVFGYYGKSSALVADSVHSISDSISDIAIIIGVKFWSKPPDEDHPHGHNKIETIITLFIGILIFILAMEFSYKSIYNIIYGIKHVPNKYTLIVAFVSIFVKELLYRWTIRKGKVLKSSVLIANAWHHRSDALSSIPVVLAILLTLINPSWGIVDSIGTLVVSIFLFQVSYVIAKEPYLALVDYSAPKNVLLKIQNVCNNFEGISNECSIRSRYLGSNAISVDLTINVKGDLTIKDADKLAHNLIKEIKKEIEEVVDVFVHVDPI